MGAVAGTVLTIDGTTVPMVLSADGPEQTEEALDVTAISDTSGTYIPNNATDGGEISLELGDIGSQFTVGATAEFTLTLVASSTTVTFDALVQSKKYNNEAKGLMKTSVVLKVTGAIS